MPAKSRCASAYRQDLRRYPETEKQLWYALNRVSYEQTTSSEQNLHFKEMTLIARSRGLDLSEEKFATLRMLDSNGKFNNLALLLSDENPHIVKFAVYKNKRMDFAVKKEFSGSWIAMLDQYPDPSLREIVVNAFAHFDASFPSDVKIEFYPDRVEIASPGALYRTTMKEVLSGRQSFRNPNLVYVLNIFNYIENYATGLKKRLRPMRRMRSARNMNRPSISSSSRFPMSSGRGKMRMRRQAKCRTNMTV